MSSKRLMCVRASVVASLTVLVLVMTVGVASAHEKRVVGQYALFVGFLHEPAIVEQPNAVQVLVRQGATEDAKPVTGLGNALKVDVKFGSQSTTLNLEEVDGDPGDYTGSFIPTAEGPYTFRVYGAIDGTNVDESFTSGPQTFSAVESSASLQFPSQVPAVASVAQAADSASNAADSARVLGIIGIVMGALGLVAGAAGLLIGRAGGASSAGREPVSGGATGDRSATGS